MTSPLIDPPSFLVDSEETQDATRSAVAAERARIRRELDDVLHKNLLGVSMIAEALATQGAAADPRELDRHLRELAKLARDAVSEARAFITGIEAEALGDELRSAVTAWGDLTGVTTSLDLGPEISAPTQVQREIVAILREALSNVERHAAAASVRVSLQIRQDRLLMTVADDGSGFCPPADLAELRSAGQAGLARTDQRVRQLGGSLTVTSLPGLGTHLEVDLPAPVSTRQLMRDTPPPVRVVLAEENPVLRRGLRACIEHSTALAIVAEAKDGYGAMAVVRDHRPDVLLLDARMLLPGQLPAIVQASEQTQVILLVNPDDAELMARATEAGATGYVIHGDFERDELIQILTETGRRSRTATAPTPAPVGEWPGRAADLRPREREVMGLIAEGLTNRQIAARLVISDKTVKNHICSIYQYLGAPDRGQAVKRWQELLQRSAPAPGTLLGIAKRDCGPVKPGSPGDGNGGHSRMDIQLAQRVLDMGAHGIP